MGEKRETPRIAPFVTSCHVVDGARRYSAYLTDLSLSGARVSCEAPPPLPEAWIVLEVRLGRAASRVRLQAQVRWVGLGRSDQFRWSTSGSAFAETKRSMAMGECIGDAGRGRA